MVSAAIKGFIRAAACVAWLVPLTALASEGPRLQTAPINSHDLFAFGSTTGNLYLSENEGDHARNERRRHR